MDDFIGSWRGYELLESKLINDPQLCVEVIRGMAEEILRLKKANSELSWYKYPERMGK